MTKSLELKISAAGKVLTKEQIAFNRLIERIKKLESSIISDKEHMDFLHAFHEKEISPLEKKQAEKHIAIAFKLNELTDRIQFSKASMLKIGDLILHFCNNAFEFITVTQEMEDLFDEWSEIPYQDELRFQKDMAKNMFAEYMRDTFGKSVDLDDLDLDDPESMAKFQAKMKSVFEEGEQQEDSDKQRKKTKKQIQKEEHQKAEELTKNKSIRNIYISLTKILHPDTETDEVLKSEKLELMKEVTTAYEQKDLSTLLRLEMEWVFKTTEHLEQLTKDKLKIYTSVLKERVAELEQEKIMFIRQPKYLKVVQYADLNQMKASKLLKQEKTHLKQNIRYFDDQIDDILNLKNKNHARDYINDMHDLEIDDFDFNFDLF